jgi:hypothetical protein
MSGKSSYRHRLLAAVLHVTAAHGFVVFRFVACRLPGPHRSSRKVAKIVTLRRDIVRQTRSRRGSVTRLLLTPGKTRRRSRCRAVGLEAFYVAPLVRSLRLPRLRE